MRIEVDDQGLKQGVLGLVLTLVEVIKDTLKMEACRRMEGERLN
ncbi:MAG: gas vesicle protein GvpK, partial [Bacillota bacterium]